MGGAASESSAGLARRVVVRRPRLTIEGPLLESESELEGRLGSAGPPLKTAIIEDDDDDQLGCAVQREEVM